MVAFATFREGKLDDALARFTTIAGSTADEAEAVTELARREMCGACELEPPLEVDAGTGPDWLAAK